MCWHTSGYFWEIISARFSSISSFSENRHAKQTRKCTWTFARRSKISSGSQLFHECPEKLGNRPESNERVDFISEKKLGRHSTCQFKEWRLIHLKKKRTRRAPHFENKQKSTPLWWYGCLFEKSGVTDRKVNWSLIWTHPDQLVSSSKDLQLAKQTTTVGNWSGDSAPFAAIWTTGTTWNRRLVKRTLRPIEALRIGWSPVLLPIFFLFDRGHFLFSANHDGCSDRISSTTRKTPSLFFPPSFFDPDTAHSVQRRPAVGSTSIGSR